MSRREYHIPTAETPMLIDCPLDSNNGLTDLVSGIDVAGKQTGDINWDATEQAYWFTCRSTSSGSKGVYLEGISLPTFDFDNYNYICTFDVKCKNISNSYFTCNAFWYAGSLNRCDMAVFIDATNTGGEIHCGDYNWHEITSIWTPQNQKCYLDGTLVRTNTVNSTVVSRRQSIVTNRYMVVGSPWGSGNGSTAYMKNLKVWREEI